ncbi:hypothetical protein [Vibrio agarivorans]|uniref:hypothetical protein n=1 Tax=Vibrio agarivorans TaxID=153622 RepID=UPI0025B589D7|nr:hypothetical protein [Vibrio agarivorans]MDN3659700.1 hypothetical protein [Vibrio agarivorans]
MKKSIIALAMVSSFAANAAYLDEKTGEVVVAENPELLGDSSGSQEEKVNYGDPTASYTGLGLERAGSNSKVTGVWGMGEHIITGEVGYHHRDKNVNFRGRYFNIDRDTNFGWSVDAMGHKAKKDGVSDSSLVGLVGGLYKWQATDNIIIAPMLYAGYGSLSVEGKQDGDKKKYSRSSGLIQTGVYGMYGFEAGHWLYANPKTTYIENAPMKASERFQNEIELGAGFMVSDNQSLGVKYTVSKLGSKKTETQGAVNYYLYF